LEIEQIVHADHEFVGSNKIHDIVFFEKEEITLSRCSVCGFYTCQCIAKQKSSLKYRLKLKFKERIRAFYRKQLERHLEKFHSYEAKYEETDRFIENLILERR